MKNKYNNGFVLITHKNCTDGTFSALVAKKFCIDNGLPEPTIIFEQYGNGIRQYSDEVIRNKDVIMCDFSYDRETIIDLHDNVTKSFVVLDHHASAEKELAGLDYCTFDMKKSGAMLMWDYFYSEQQAPRIVEYVQDRDIWKWELENSKEFSAGLNLHKDFNLLQDYDIDYVFSDKLTDTCVKEGNAILAYQRTVIDKVVRGTLNKKGRTAGIVLYNIGGHEVPVINSTNLISEIGNELSKDNPFSAQYFFTNHEEIVFSLRSQPGGVDVSEVAKRYGGGGHKAAAGMSFDLKDIKLDVFFDTKNLDLALK